VKEETLTLQIVALLRSCGLPAWRTHDTRNHPVEKGIADVNAVMPDGTFLPIEVKKPGAEKAHADRRVVQNGWIAWIERMTKARGLTVSSIEEVISFLSQKGISVRLS
jgi:hypothetical protein